MPLSEVELIYISFYNYSCLLHINLFIYFHLVIYFCQFFFIYLFFLL